jgi:hypothetical protein
MIKVAFEVLYFDVDTFEELARLTKDMAKEGWKRKNYRILKSCINEKYIRAKFSKGDFTNYEHEYRIDAKGLFEKFNKQNTDVDYDFKVEYFREY